MRKNKNPNVRKVKKVVKNPFNGVKTRDLLITFIFTLLVFVVGFFGGFSCKSITTRTTASADVYLEDSFSTPAIPNQNNAGGGLQYVFTNYLGNSLHIFNFVLYQSYTPAYLNSTHGFAQADTNDYSPADYVSQQLYTYTSEDEYFGLDLLPSMSNVEAELYYCWWSEDDDLFNYSEETLFYFCSVVSYSNLAEGGFLGNLKYLITNEYGFAIVLENGSYYGVCLAPAASAYYSRWFRFLITEGIGTIYTYADIFGFNTSDDIYIAGYNNGYGVGYDNGYAVGESYGYYQGEQSGYSTGYDTGYSNGYQVGATESLSDITPWRHIVTAVNEFLEIEVLPNVPFSLVFSIFFGLILFGFAVKIFLGG